MDLRASSLGRHFSDSDVSHRQKIANEASLPDLRAGKFAGALSNEKLLVLHGCRLDRFVYLTGDRRRIETAREYQLRQKTKDIVAILNPDAGIRINALSPRFRTPAS